MRSLLTGIGIILLALNARAQDYCGMDRFDTFVFDSSDVEVVKNIQYGEAINWLDNVQELYLDVYMPPADLDPLAKKPCVFFVHGGGLVGGSKESTGAAELGYLYASMGYVYVSIDYRVGWENGEGEEGCNGDTADLFRATYRALQDVKAAYRFIRAEAATYGIDTNYIFVEGNSVGSRQIALAVYAMQEDFDPMLYAELGSIDTAVNAYTNFGFSPRGVITEALGIENREIITRKDFPHLLFHGTCDSIVPFFSGPTFFCFQPLLYPKLYGSYDLVQTLKENSRAYQFYIGEGAGHDAVIPDSIVLYAAPFMKEILCGTMHTEEFYRVLGKFKCAVANEGELVITELYPNPVTDLITMEVTSTRSREIEVDIYNSLGQSLLSSELPFSPPIGNYTIDVSTFPHGIYFMRMSQRQEAYILKFVKL